MTTAVSAQDVKALRERTGAGMMDCKRALEETSGDMDRAVELLRVKGQAQAAKRGTRVASEGVVQSYIHANGKIGVLVEVDCETDFVARNEDFREFARDVALHVAAAGPAYEQLGPKESAAETLEAEAAPATVAAEAAPATLEAEAAPATLELEAEAAPAVEPEVETVEARQE